MKKARVSFILIAYNHERYIKDAIEGILAQTYSPDEIIIVDDCSDDATLSIIESYAIQDSRIHIIPHPYNMGPSRALNSALHIATGEYIVMQGGDDISLPHRVEKQISYLEEHADVGAICTHVEAINDLGHFTESLQPVHDVFNISHMSREAMLARFFIDNNFLNASSQTIRASIFNTVGFYNPTLLQFQDYDMNVRISLIAPIVIMEDVLLKYRIRDDGNNISVGKGLRSIRMLLETGTILQNYLHINDPAHFKRIFRKYKNTRIRTETIPYFLGMLLLESDVNLSRKLWAIETVYSVINRDGIQDILHEDIGYSYKKFITLAEYL